MPARPCTSRHHAHATSHHHAIHHIISSLLNEVPNASKALPSIIQLWCVTTSRHHTIHHIVPYSHITSSYNYGTSPRHVIIPYSHSTIFTYHVIIPYSHITSSCHVTSSCHISHHLLPLKRGAQCQQGAEGPYISQKRST